MDYKIYILFGYPGSGKGTFAQALKEKGYLHISTGDILRDEVKRKTPIGLKYKKEIESASKLLPKLVIEKLIFTTVTALIERKENFILDGFPKTIEQAKHLDELIDKYSLRENVFVVHIDVPLKVALERIQTRRTCAECGRIYNLLTAKPKIQDICDLCGASLIQRACDSAEDFHKRILLFNKTVKKVLDYYKSKDALIKTL